MSVDLLSNIVWHSLTGNQARLSEGTPNVRRYARGYTPLVGFADTLRPDLAALATCCDPGEHLYCGGWNGPAPSGWTIEADSAAHQMTFDGPAPPQDDALDARRLDARDAREMLALAQLTRPGPFGERTVEMGEYWGVYDAGRLIAMAGERMHAGALREVSGVCTHPEFQGRGLARRLMAKLVLRQMRRGETPFLHVMSGNANARGLYVRMGFRDYREAVVRVVAPA